MKKEDIFNEGKIIQVKPIRGIKNGEEGVKFVNEKYSDMPEIFQTMDEYKQIIPPSIRHNADYEEILKRYLESTFAKSCDDDAEFYGRLSLHEFQYSYARDICKKLGFMAGSRITDKGIEFLEYLQQKDLLLKQSKINLWLTRATIILAIGTLIQVLILILK